MKSTPIVLSSSEDLSLDLAERVAFGNCDVVLGDRGRAIIDGGRREYERYLDTISGEHYIYGTTTAPGSRAKKVLDAATASNQGRTLREFVTIRAGLGGSPMPRRTVRLAVLARLSNAMSGRGKITSATADKVVGLLSSPPEVPFGETSEVMALTWLMAPLADVPLLVGEAMALINGSPFTSAMVVDAVLMGRRRIHLAEEVFALSIEAARAPLEHYTPQLADLWPDPFYRASLESLNALLAKASPDRLKHQAPVSWRIIPNLLATGKRALSSAEEISRNSLRAVKDNPTFLGPSDGEAIGRTVSSGGYHDDQAARAIEALTSSYASLCVLIGKQVTRLIDGEGLGLPRMMVRPGVDGVGTEYFVWTLNDKIRRAQQATIPVSLAISLEDPGGGQSDVTSAATSAYARHLEAGSALTDCLATLATVSALSLKIRNGSPPHAPSDLWSLLTAVLGSVESTSAACGEPLREIAEKFRAGLENFP